MAEDETAIKAIIEYNQKDDELVGFCNVNTKIPKDHCCFQGTWWLYHTGLSRSRYEGKKLVRSPNMHYDQFYGAHESPTIGITTF